MVRKNMNRKTKLIILLLILNIVVWGGVFYIHFTHPLQIINTYYLP